MVERSHRESESPGICDLGRSLGCLDDIVLDIVKPAQSKELSG